MKLFFYILFFLFSSSCFAQSSSSSLDKDLDFIFYLAQHGQFTDIDFYGNKLLSNNNLTGSQKDSLNFVLGHIEFKRFNYDKSRVFLTRVSRESWFYPKSSFYTEICSVNKSDYETAYNYLKPIEFDKSNELLNQLKLFELAGLSLLKRDYSSFDSLSSLFNTTNEILNKEQLLLKENLYELKKLKRKSPVIAGTLSAIIPGLGLAYAGNNGQALATFIRVIALGAFCTETYLKLGPRNPQFITSASLFSIFYMGNIWGSILCVQIVKNEKLKEIDNNIMVGLRIPVDKFFK